MDLKAQVLQLDDDDRATLESWSRSTAIRAGLVTRARIVLAAAEGLGTTETARRVGVSRPTVIQWRDRYVEHGLAGLEDAPRSGRPKRVDGAAIPSATLDLATGEVGGDVEEAVAIIDLADRVLPQFDTA